MRVAGEHWATPDGAAYDGVRLGETVERPDAGREVVQSGEVFEVAAVATEQDVSEVGEAVDVLFDGSEGVTCGCFSFTALRSPPVSATGIRTRQRREANSKLRFREFSETFLLYRFRAANWPGATAGF